MQRFDKSIGVQRFEDQVFVYMMQFNEVVHDESLVGAEVDMQVEGTAESMQDFLVAILCDSDDNF